MNTRKFSEAMNELDDRYIAEAISYKPDANRILHFRRLPVALIAAILALLLMGAGVAAIIYGDSIQNWFEYQWERMTGQTMTESHSAIIDHLSQEIGVSQTVGDTTVTMDSVTVGDDIIYLLLRVEETSLNKRHNYGFDSFDMKVSPDPLENDAGMGAIGLQFYGLDGDGVALFLMEFEYGSQSGFEPDMQPLEVTVHLEDFLRIGARNKNKVLTKGKWEIAFTIDRSQLPETILLPDTNVTAYNFDDELVFAMHTNIELTNTGIRFHSDSEDRINYGRLTGNLLNSQTYVILKNGEIVEVSGGMGVPLEDSELWAYSYHWRIPISLDEVAAVQIGETQITVPQN